MDKNTLRQQMLDMRKVMREADVHHRSKMICEKLICLPIVQNARHIMAYYAHQNEVDVMEFMDHSLDDGKYVYLPRVVGEGRIAPAGFHHDCRMTENRYGIPEPDIQSAYDLLVPDVIIVPGVVFDTGLRRIGYGGGYYDRYLTNVDAVKIGVCFDGQIVDRIAPDKHDVPMDIIITEKRILERR